MSEGLNQTFLGFTCEATQPNSWVYKDDYVLVQIMYLDESWGSGPEYKVYVTPLVDGFVLGPSLDWTGPSLEDIEVNAREYTQRMWERLGWLLSKR